MAFELNQRVITADGKIGEVFQISTYIHVRFEDGSEQHYMRDGQPCCGAPDIRPHSAFTVGMRVTYLMVSSDTAEGEIVKIDDDFIHVRLAADQSHIRHPDTPRVFNLDGTGVGRFVTIPEGTRTSDRGGRIIDCLPTWEPTKGREYPEKPSITYGAWDTYNGRPLQPGNPVGEGVTLGWGVLWDDPNFSQMICDSKEQIESYNYVSTALAQWKDKCLDIDLDAVENPFDVLLGCRVHRMWLHADSFGCELYLPVAPGVRHWVAFNYPAVCCTSGMIAFDDLNRFFGDNAGAMGVMGIDGTKITINETSFHIIPKFKEQFKPRITLDGGVSAKERLLQNLAMQLAKRDSTLAIAA